MDRTFGELLRGHRVGLGLTQQALTEKAQLSEQAIGALERGDGRPPPPPPQAVTMDLLIGALGLIGTERKEFVRAGSRKGKPRHRGTAPRQLPAGIDHFTGRSGQTQLIADIVRDRSTAGLVAFTGMGGVGHRGRREAADGARGAPGAAGARQRLELRSGHAAAAGHVRCRGDHHQPPGVARRAAGPAGGGRARGRALEVVRRCGGLPLAVRLAGARLAASRTWPVSYLAERLADAEHRLDELDQDEGDDMMRACLLLDLAVAKAGLAQRNDGKFPAALRHVEDSVVLFEAHGDDALTGRALNNACYVHRLSGAFDKAIAYGERALAKLDPDRTRGITLVNLAEIYALAGDRATQQCYLAEALAILEPLDDAHGMAYAFVVLGLAQRADGQLAEAIASLRRSAEQWHRISDTPSEANTLIDLGETLPAAGQPDAARLVLVDALAMIPRYGDPVREKRARA